MGLKLLDYQTKAVERFIKHKKLLLWADVGCGKTPMALVMAERCVPTGKTLYVCPSILKQQVLKELQHFTTLTGVAVEGTHEERVIQLASPAQVYIINYEMIRTHMKELQLLNPQMIILDECQKIAQPTNKTTKYLKKLLNPEYKLAMSGTPCPNNLWELWSVADWLYPKAFGENFYQWRSINCKMNPYFPQIIGYYNEEKVRRQFNQFVERIRREDVLKLPALEEKRIEVELDKEHRKVYEDLRTNLFLEIKDKETISVPNLLALLIRLRQITDAPKILGIEIESAKEKALAEIIELHPNEKIIVFFEYSQVLHEINKKFKAQVIDGQVSQNDRQIILANFRENKEAKLLFGTSAMSEGLNMEFCHIVVHFQLAFTDAKIEQRNGRVWRLKQEHGCISYKIIAKKTIDEKIEKIIAKKRRLTRDDLIKLL